MADVVCIYQLPAHYCLTAEIYVGQRDVLTVETQQFIKYIILQMRDELMRIQKSATKGGGCVWRADGGRIVELKQIF